MSIIILILVTFHHQLSHTC